MSTLTVEEARKRNQERVNRYRHKMKATRPEAYKRLIRQLNVHTIRNRDRLRVEKAAYLAEHREEIEAERDARRAVRIAAQVAKFEEEKAKIRASRPIFDDPAHVKQRARREASKEARNAYQRVYDQVHKEERRAYHREYARKHREMVNASVRAHKAKHPEKDQVSRHRRAISRGRFTHTEWLAMQEKYNHCCAYCLTRVKGHLTQDHVMPLSKDGLHAAFNIVPACTRCNMSKKAGTVTELRQFIAARSA